MKLFFFTAFFLVINCSDVENSTSGQDKDKETIDKLRQEIVDMAKNSICSETYTCDVVGIGSKPCGGHWEYLVYSSSIDVEELLEKADQLYELEKAYNEKHGIGSDCMVVSPPDDIICEDGKCQGVYQ